jgi:hypothetical protein
VYPKKHKPIDAFAYSISVHQAVNFLSRHSSTMAKKNTSRQEMEKLARQYASTMPVNLFFDEKQKLTISHCFE